MNGPIRNQKLQRITEAVDEIIRIAKGEELGAVDTGPPAEWYHLDYKTDGEGITRALCGEVVTQTLTPEQVKGLRLCPDCKRIAWVK
jgi:hypothetical protein